MKYVGEARVIGVNKFYAKRPESTVKILAKSDVLATISSSGASFLSSRFLLRSKEMWKINILEVNDKTSLF